jgi:hypothetical protein
VEGCLEIRSLARADLFFFFSKTPDPLSCLLIESSSRVNKSLMVGLEFSTWTTHTIMNNPTC